MAAAISASVKVSYVVDLKVIVFVPVTVFSPFINTIAESCVRGLYPRSMLVDIPVIAGYSVFDTCHYGDNPERWNLERCTEETREFQKQLEESFAQLTYFR